MEGGGLSVARTRFISNRLVADDVIGRNCVASSKVGGGAIRVIRGNCSITDSVFEENRAGRRAEPDHYDDDDDDNSKAPAGQGGAVFFENGNNQGEQVGTCTVRNSNFTLNEALQGGGLALFEPLHFHLSNSIFTFNKAGSSPSEDSVLHIDAAGYMLVSGGAIRLYSSSKNTEHLGQVHDSSFISNEAPMGGAICVDGTGIVTNSNFISNVAGQGGAIYSLHGVILSKSSFIGNRAIEGGGAIRLREVPSSLVRHGMVNRSHHCLLLCAAW